MDLAFFSPEARLLVHGLALTETMLLFNFGPRNKQIKASFLMILPFLDDL